MQPIDWDAIEARRGTQISQDQRALIEMQVLADESRRLLTRADQVERWGESERETIAEAYAEGQSVAGYLAEQQGADMDWTTEQEERAAGYPGAMPDDYQAPVLTEALREEDEMPYEAAVDYSGPGGDFDLQPDAAFENQYPETKDFEDLTPEDVTYLAEKYPEQQWGRDTDDTDSPGPYDAGRADREQLGRVEDQIRQTYREVTGGQDRLVTLAELRAALPAELPREQVDAALTNLRDHSDVHMSPRTAQRNATPENQAAALAVGGTHDHQILIERTQNPKLVAERLHSRDEGRATSMVAALDDTTVRQVATELGVPVSEDVQQVRADLVATSVANQQAWLADARQGANDGTMLYRADTEPGWAASLGVAERQELAAAAERLQQRADTEPAWAYVKDRADRWADPGTRVDNPAPAREAGRAREADSPAREAGTASVDPPSVGPELRAARTYLEQRTERDPAPREPVAHDTGAQQEQAHRDSARVMAERQQSEPQRGIER